MKLLSFVLLPALLLFSLVLQNPVAPQTPTAVRENPNRIYQLKDLQRVTITVGERKVNVWVMDTESKRQEGMMFLTNAEVKDDEGMLFVFGREQPLAFWMENTILPLDIIYMNSRGVVLNIANGRPFNRTQLPSAGPAMFVLELKAGTSRRWGIRPGTRILIPQTVKAKEF